MEYHVRDISRAQNYRLDLRDKVKNKKEEIKKTTLNPDIQKALFGEFISAERNSEKYQKSCDVLKWTHSFEKEHGPIDKTKLVLNNVKGVGEKDLREKGFFDIGEYMGRFESNKDYIFTKEDFEEIMKHFLDELDARLDFMKDLLKQRQDRDVYENALKNPAIGQQLITQTNNPMILGLKHALYNYFVDTLGREYSSNFNYKKEDMQKIFRDHSRRFLEQLSVLGDMTLYEYFKSNRFCFDRNSDFYDNLKKINIFKGNANDTFAAARSGYANMIVGSVQAIGKSFEASDFLRKIGAYSQGGDWRLEMTSKELEGLALNKAREEQKDGLISKIHSLTYDINRIAGEKLHDTNDYYVWESDSKYGKKGKPLMKKPLPEIEKVYMEMQNQLAQLQEQKKTGVSEILSLLQNKPISENPSGSSKKTKK